MENKLVLLGGGGHCKSVLDAALRMNKFDEIVITDPDLTIGSSILGAEVVGADDCLERLRENGFKFAFVTVGNTGINPLREMLAEKAASLGYQFPVIIDPSAIISESATIDSGTFIGKNVMINADVTIGKHSIINTGAIIEHECNVGDFTHISVGTILCGEVVIGKNSFVGAGSTVIQCVNVGDDVVIGASSTVLADVKNKFRVYGVVKNDHTKENTNNCRSGC